jgi:hypothetical protein
MIQQDQFEINSAKVYADDTYHLFFLVVHIRVKKLKKIITV